MNTQTKLITRLAVMACAGLMLGGLSAPAFAAARTSSDVKMTIDRADLATERGIKRVYASIKSKANSACDGDTRTSLARRIQIKACTADFISDIVAQVSHERLTAYHQAMTG